MENILFELKKVSFSYRDIPALRDVDLVIRTGEKAAFIGANGTGKSTMLSVLDGIVFPDSGAISVFGRTLGEKQFDDNEFSLFFRSRVGFVFQDPDVQLFCPTVRDDIVFGPLHLGVPDSEIKKRLETLSALFNLGMLLGRSPHRLSIGEKKKVAIATVLAVQPDVLLLDEPTAGLDPQTSQDIIDIILAENKKGRTVITATHDLHTVEEISDVVHVFGKDNRIVRTGKPDEILSDRDFLQEHNLIHRHAHRHGGVEHTHSHLHIVHHH